MFDTRTRTILLALALIIYTVYNPHWLTKAPDPSKGYDAPWVYPANNPTANPATAHQAS
jgi:hypothetical protein